MKNFMINLIQHPVSLIVVSIISVAIGERALVQIQMKKAEAKVKKYGGSAEVRYRGMTLNEDYKFQSK